MKYKFLFISIVVMVLSCRAEQESTQPKMTFSSQSIYASVTVMPEDMYEVYTSSPGILHDILVDEGDLVTRGQVIARIRTIDSKNKVNKASIDLAQAEANYTGKSNNLDEIKDEIYAAQKTLELDSLNLIRRKNLWNENIGSRSELDNAELKYNLSKNTIARLYKKYDQTNTQLELQFEKSKNALDEVNNKARDYNIQSRINGTVYQLLKYPGEYLSTQQPLALLGQSDEFIIEMIIDEVDIASVEIGQTAFVSLEAYQEEVYTVEVIKIIPLKDDRTQTYTVEATFITKPRTLYAGLSGEANIVISDSINVMTIPSNYLIDDSSVMTSDGEKIISIGMRNTNTVEVLSGIDTNTVLLKPDMR